MTMRQLSKTTRKHTYNAMAHSIAALVCTNIVISTSNAWAGGGPDPGGLPVTTVSWGNPTFLAIAQIGLIGTTAAWRWWRR